MAHPFRAPSQMLTLVLLTALLGCDDPLIEPTPEPGALTLSLSTPHADDRGLIIEVTGPATVSAVQALGDYRVHARLSENSFRVAVFGSIQDGAVLTFVIPDVGLVEAYTARVLEAAAASNELRPSTSAYTVQIRR